MAWINASDFGVDNAFDYVTMNYRENGYYFVTICTKHRTPWFATSQAKCLVQQKMEHIPQFFSGVSIDQAVVMPNHLHVIFCFSIVGYIAWSGRSGIEVVGHAGMESGSFLMAVQLL